MSGARAPATGPEPAALREARRAERAVRRLRAWRSALAVVLAATLLPVWLPFLVPVGAPGRAGPLAPAAWGGVLVAALAVAAREWRQWRRWRRCLVALGPARWTTAGARGPAGRAGGDSAGSPP